MAKWIPFPHAGEFDYTPASLKKQWARLHAGDAEPLPKDAAVLQAWAHYHNGNFQQAAEEGLAAGGDGITVANKATATSTGAQRKGKPPDDAGGGAGVRVSHRLPLQSAT